MVDMDDLVKEDKESKKKIEEEELDEEKELEDQVRKLKEKQAKEEKIKSLKSEKYELENPIKSKIMKAVKSIPSKVGSGVKAASIASYRAVEKAASNAAKSQPQDKNSVRLGFNPNAMNDTFGTWGQPKVDQNSVKQQGYGFLQGSDPWGFNKPQAAVQQMSRKIIYKGKGKNKKKIVIMRPVPMQSAPVHNPFGGDYNIYAAAGKKQPQNNPWRMI